MGSWLSGNFHVIMRNCCETIDSRFIWSTFPGFLALGTIPEPSEVFPGLAGKGLWAFSEPSPMHGLASGVHLPLTLVGFLRS